MIVYDGRILDYGTVLMQLSRSFHNSSCICVPRGLPDAWPNSLDVASGVSSVVLTASTSGRDTTEGTSLSDNSRRRRRLRHRLGEKKQRRLQEASMRSRIGRAERRVQFRFPKKKGAVHRHKRQQTWALSGPQPLLQVWPHVGIRIDYG